MSQAKKIYGFHAIREALIAGKEIDKIFVKRELKSEELSDIKLLADQANVPLIKVPHEKLNRITSNNHQGLIAFMAAIEYMPLDELIANCYEQGRMPLFLLLDGLTDIRNFGAIARSAECFGVDAIVIPGKGSVTISPDAIKTSSGALMRIPVCRTQNIKEALDIFSNNGIDILVASEKSNKTFREAHFDRPLVLVMGAEDHGVSPETLRRATEILSITQFGKIASLNVSVAAGIILYEISNQRYLNQI